MGLLDDVERRLGILERKVNRNAVELDRLRDLTGYAANRKNTLGMYLSAFSTSPNSNRSGGPVVVVPSGLLTTFRILSSCDNAAFSGVDAQIKGLSAGTVATGTSDISGYISAYLPSGDSYFLQQYGNSVGVVSSFNSSGFAAAGSTTDWTAAPASPYVCLSTCHDYYDTTGPWTLTSPDGSTAMTGLTCDQITSKTAYSRFEHNITQVSYINTSFATATRNVLVVFNVSFANVATNGGKPTLTLTTYWTTSGSPVGVKIASSDLSGTINSTSGYLAVSTSYNGGRPTNSTPGILSAAPGSCTPTSFSWDLSGNNLAVALWGATPTVTISK